MRLHIHKQRWDHGDGFLPGDGSCLILSNDQLVHLHVPGGQSNPKRCTGRICCPVESASIGTWRVSLEEGSHRKMTLST